MGGIVVEVGFTRSEHAQPDAAAHFHEHVVERVVGWVEQHLHTELDWLEDYYAEAKRYAAQRDLWGPSGDKLVYLFPDFAGLHHLGSHAFSHWFELALSVLDPYLRLRADELGLRLLDRPRGADRLAATPSDTPLVQLDKHTYWIEWSGHGPPPPDEPILLSRDDLPRRTLSSLAADERALVERVLLHRLCQCDPCSYVRPRAFGGRDPWSGGFDFGMKRGEVLLRAGDCLGARRELARGAMLGAPWEGWQYAVWIACAFARDVDADPKHRARAFRWLARSLGEGHDCPERLGDDDDIEALRGRELDALIARGAQFRPPFPAASRAHLGRAHELVSGELSALAGVAGAELVGDGLGRLASPLPTSFLLLLEQLRLRDALGPIAEVAALCMRSPRGTFAELTEQLALSFDPSLSITVSEASIVYPRPDDERSTVELRVWGDRRVTELDTRTGTETHVGLLTRLELTRLVCDAYDARFGELLVPLTSRFAPISPTGRPPPASRVTVCFPGEPPRWCEAGIADGGAGATFFALQHHVDGVTSWARHRAAPIDPRPARFPRWTIAEQRARTMKQLVRAAGGDPTAIEIAWHGPASETEVEWFTLDDKAIFRRASMTSSPYQATKRQGIVSPAEVVRIAKELVALSFPSLGVIGATRDPVARPRAGSIGLRVSTRHDVMVEVELPETALLDHPSLASLFDRLNTLLSDARRRDPSRRELVLPARAHDEPRTLPLHLVVLGDLRGERATTPLSDVPMRRVSSDDLDAVRSRLLAGKSEAAVPVWREIEALCATARDTGAAVLIELLDVGLDDLRDDFDDAADLGKSGLCHHLVSGTLDSLGGTPIDAVLLAMDLGARDVQYLHKLETLLENGPMPAFARLPPDAARSRHRLVDVEPFAAGRALIHAFANDPLCRAIDGLSEAQAASFAVARVARHLSQVQLAGGTTHRSFSRVEQRARTWLSSQAGYGRPLSSYVLTEEDDQMSSTAISYTLQVKFELGLQGSVPFLLRLGGAIASDPSGDVLVREALLTAPHGGVVRHHVVCGGSTGPASGRWLRVSATGDVSMIDLVNGASVETTFGPASGESFLRLIDALAAWAETDAFLDAPASPPVCGLVVGTDTASVARLHPTPSTAWSPTYTMVMRRLEEAAESAIGYDLCFRDALEGWQRQLGFSTPPSVARLRPFTPPEQAAFERVLASPDDDDTRAALASLLVDANDPRGDFMVTQLRLAKLLRAQAVYRDYAPFAARSRALLEEHQAAWALPIAGLAERPTFRRGLIEGVAMSPRAFVARADALFRVAPILHLDVLGADGIEELFASPHLARLRSLNLFDQRIGDRGAWALSVSPYAARLTWLDLGYNQLTTDGLAWLLASPNLPRLAWVNLVSNGFEDPCDQLGGVEGDTIHTFDTPSNQAELERRYGPKRWLHWRPSSPQTMRPDPIVFVGGPQGLQPARSLRWPRRPTRPLRASPCPPRGTAGSLAQRSAPRPSSPPTKRHARGAGWARPGAGARVSDPWSAVYESPLHHPTVAWVAVALGALALARRLPFLHGYLVVFGLEIFADALASAPFTKLPGVWATVASVTFVILGDLRFFVLVERHARAATSLTARALFMAIAMSLVVPLASTAVRLAVPAVEAAPRLQFLVYELAFLAVALTYVWVVLRRRLADAPPDVQRWLRAVALFEATQYGLWAFADVLIHFGGQQWALGLRLLPNALYYALFLPFVFAMAPARMRAVA